MVSGASWLTTLQLSQRAPQGVRPAEMPLPPHYLSASLQAEEEVVHKAFYQRHPRRQHQRLGAADG